MLELNGDAGLMMYRLHLHGGPQDGNIANSFRPYHELRYPDGVVYRTLELPPDYLVWVDDWTRSIHLHFVEPDP